MALPTTRQQKRLENIVREVRITKQLNKHILARYNFKLLCIFLFYNFTSTRLAFAKLGSKAGMRKCWVLVRTLCRHKSMLLYLVSKTVYRSGKPVRPPQIRKTFFCKVIQLPSPIIAFKWVTPHFIRWSC